MAKLVIKDWLARIAFKDMVLYGLVKSYNIKNNSDRNIQLMGIILNKMFELDSSHFEEDVLAPFNSLFDQKKDKIKMFYKELIDIPDVKSLSLESIFEEHNSTKFQHHCMCLTLPDIQLLYKFFREYKTEFS